MSQQAETQTNLEYVGNRREAALLAAVLVIGSVAAIATRFTAAAPSSVADWVGNVFVALLFGLMAWGGLALVRARGMTLRVVAGAIEAEEWYGQRRLLPVKQPITMDQVQTVNLGRKLNLRLSDYQRRLHIGGEIAYVSLEGCEDPESAARDLLALLHRMASDEEDRAG